MSDDDEVSCGGNSGNTSDCYSYLEEEEEEEEEEGYASSINYCYSEEETYYVPENDDTCDEDRAKSQEDEYVDKTELQNEGISADVSERRVPDSKMDDKSLAVYDNVDAKDVYAFKLNMISRDNWMRTWPATSMQSLVSVYSFHNKQKGFGGYAVIVCNMSATPVTASAKFTRYSFSFLDEVLMGLEAGLDLALKHGCSSPTVLCNSRLVVRLLNRVASDICRCKSRTVSAICETCTMEIVPQMNKNYFRNLVPLIITLQGKRGSSTIEWDSGKNEAAHYLAKKVKKNSVFYGYPFYQAVMEKPEDFPEELVDILFEDAYHTSYGRTGIAVSKASTGITSKDGDRAGNNLSGDLRDGNSNVVEATGSNSNITSNAGAEVVLPTREEVPTSVKGVKSMAEKGQGGDEVVNSSAGDKKGGKGISVSYAAAVVLGKEKTNTMGSAVVRTSLEEDSATVVDSSLSAGTGIWIPAKGKKKYPAGKGDTNEKVETLKVKNPFMVFGDFKMEDLLLQGLKFPRFHMS